ncbi:hypothetical protein [Acidithiobacillus sp.]|uniref:hypothetical protein n=1 Tax=Acidithiobacillus sp. TaxID=1872118 RepID=UPI003D057A03
MMALLPYGGFCCDVADDPRDNPWKTLKTIQQNLEKCEELRPDHARWLGNAIERCHDDPNTFLRLLGIKKPKGKPSPFPLDSWLEYGQRICALEGDGETPEHAISIVLDELAKLYQVPPDRRTLQRWRDVYRSAEETGYL